MSIEVRLMRREEAHHANDFFNAVYKTNRTINNFNWEFFEGPCGPAIYVIAIDLSVSPTRIVGIQCAIPLRLVSTDGRAFTTAKSEDTLVDPAYRGKKIFERMYELLFTECERAGIGCIWGFTPAKKAFERIGFEIPFQAHQALRVSQPLAAFRYLSKLNPGNSIIDRLKIAGLSMMSWMSGMRSMGSGQRSHISMRSASLASDPHDALNLMQQEQYFFLEMSAAYIEWRLLRNPFDNHYELYEFLIADKVVAAVIINIRESLSYLEQVVFDKSVSDQDRRAIISMLTTMIAKRSPLLRVLCFDINPELRAQEQLLSQSGFIILRRGAHFVWKTFVGDQIDPRKVFLSRLFTQGNQ